MVHLLNIQLKQSTLATLLVLVFIVPSFLPIVGADDPSNESSTESRNAQLDFTFCNSCVLQLSNSGSSTIGANLYLEPGVHTVTTNVIALGSGSGELWLVLQHKGSQILDFSDVPGSTISMGLVTGDVGGGVKTLPSTSFSWTATTGVGQELRVKIISSNEAGNLLLNNEQPLGLSFSVENKHFGEVLSNTFPAVTPLTPPLAWTPSISVDEQMMLPKTIHPLNVTVTNSGVKNLSAQMTIVMKSNTSAADITYTSNTIAVMLPGSYPPSSLTMQDTGLLSIDLDAVSLTGVWSFLATIAFTGTAWSETVVIQDTYVRFSNYSATVLEPSTQIAEPGEVTLLTFIVQNTGFETDSFAILMTESASPAWTDGTNPAFGLTMNGRNPLDDASEGEVRIINVEVTIPADAARSMTDTITLKFTSIATAGTTDAYEIIVTGRVMVGDFYDGTVNLTQGALPKQITPGDLSGIQFPAVVSNTGSVATAFILSTGLSMNALNWTVGVQPSVTPPIQPGSTHQVTVTITAPAIQNPIITGERNMANDALSVWIQSQPIGGGVPVTSSAPIVVKAVIVVDPGLSTDPYMMNETELNDQKQGGMFSHVADLNLRVVHNLPANLIINTLDATITKELSFIARTEGGFSEAGRWSATISKTFHQNINPGSTMKTTLNIAGPPGGEYPLGGTFSATVTVTPTLNAALAATNVSSLPFSQVYSVIVPSTVEGEFLERLSDELVPAGVPFAFPLSFSNTGNDAASYRLRIVDDLPENWIANFSDTDSLISSLTSDVADGTIDALDPLSLNTTHKRTVMFNIKTAPLATAGSVETISVRIEDPVSGQLIGDVYTFGVEVDKVFNATLSPTNQTQYLDIGQETFTSLYIQNTGNAPADYSISLDTTLAGAVNFEIESPASSKVFIAAGFEDSIRIKMTANSDANADGVYMATVRVSANDGLILLSANIIANISVNHSFSVIAPSQMSVTPGMQEKVDFEIVNNGNSAETVLVNFTVQGNLTLSEYSMEVTIPIGGSFSDQLIVSIPSLGGADLLLQGDAYNLTITVYNITSNMPFDGSKSIELLVQPLFIVESNDWPSVMEFRPKSDRTWEVTLTNTGNQDVTVFASHLIYRPGFAEMSEEQLTLLLNQDPQPEIYSTDWKMLTEDSLIFLPRNTPVVHTFTLVGDAANPLLALTADVALSLSPQKTFEDEVETTVQGNGKFTTQLIMSRFYAGAERGIRPEVDDGPVYEEFQYSNIPVSNGSVVAYELELCNSERLRDISALGQNPLNYSWNFYLVETKPDGTTQDHPLDLEEECGSTSLGPTSRYSLPPQSPWNAGIFSIKADIPNRGSILPGDGWDLTFRLYHPDENLGYTVYSEATFTLVLAVYADPSIVSISFAEELEEGKDNTITVVVQNIGTAKALDAIVYLECDGLTVATKNDETPSLYPGTVAGGLSQVMIKDFYPGDTKTLQWGVKADTIDWWSQKTDVNCNARINASYMDRNVESNDELVLKEEVSSWSPGVSNSFISCIACLLVSVILFRLTAQNDNFRLLGIYSGVLGLGFSFHIFSQMWWSFVVLIISAIWIWRVSWGTTAEFRLLHEDYQRARKGVSTLYGDHFDELAKARRQLSWILSVPVLGMLAIILGIEPRLTMDSINMISLATYIGVVVIGVWLLIRRADHMYGSLYGRLTDIEVKSIRLERDLGDPARLFNELAADGLNLDEIFGDVDTSRPLHPEALFSSEEVNDDA